MKACFLSDLHLKSEEKDKAKLFINYLSSIDNSVSHLILLGDIFDLWIAGHQYFKDKFPLVIGQIRRIVEMGAEVHYFEGNHDLHLKSFWEKELGVKVHSDKFILNLFGFKVRVEHGDQMNPEDKGYLFLRWALRTLPLKMLSENLPGSVIGWIGERSSQVSRIYTDRLSRQYIEQVKNMTRAYAMKEFEKDTFDFIITGHTHIKDDFEFVLNGKKGRSINLGSWLDQPKVLVLDENKIEFKYLSQNH